MSVFLFNQEAKEPSLGAKHEYFKPYALVYFYVVHRTQFLDRGGGAGRSITISIRLSFSKL